MFTRVRAMENLFLERVTREVSSELVGARVERVTGIPPMSLALEFSVENAPPRVPLLLICLDPKFPGILTLEKPLPHAPAGTNPEGFVKLLNEKLRGRVLRQVQQHGRDRVARLDFAGRTGSIEDALWIEFFGRRPIAALVDPSTDTIIACSREGLKSGSGTLMRTGAPYAPPEDRKKISVEGVSPGHLASWMKESGEEELGVVLSRKIEGLSPQAAQAVVESANAAEGATGQGHAGRRPSGNLPSPEKLLESLSQHLLEPDRYLNLAVKSTLLSRESGTGGGPRFGVTLFPFGAFPQNGGSECGLQHFETAMEAVRFCFNELCRWYRMTAAARLRSDAAALAERLSKLRLALAQDLKSAEQGQKHTRMGELILANLKSIRRGLDVVQLKDIHGEGQATVAVSLDPALSPSENADRYFKRARKAKRAVVILNRRIAELSHNIDALEQFAARVPDEVSSRDVLGLGRKLELIARRTTRKAGTGLQEPKKEQEKRRGTRGGALARVGKPSARAGRQKFNPRHFTTSDGHSVIVGRNNAENDYVTHRLAKPEDLWFHAYGVKGSHVILRKKGKSAPSRRAIEEAASIAAYFSKGKTSSSLPVIFTQRKYVNRPRGTRPGTATCTREKLIMVRPTKPLSQ